MSEIDSGIIKANFGSSQPISVRELPDVTIGDAGKVLKVNPEGNWAALNEAELPAATSEDAGKILKVGNDGTYGLANETKELPSYSSEDEGKVLSVDSNGDLEFANVPTIKHLSVTVTTGLNAITLPDSMTYDDLKALLDIGTVYIVDDDTNEIYSIERYDSSSATFRHIGVSSAYVLVDSIEFNNLGGTYSQARVEIYTNP